jgi:hypothetical protein
MAFSQKKSPAFGCLVPDGWWRRVEGPGLALEGLGQIRDLGLPSICITFVAILKKANQT